LSSNSSDYSKGVPEEEPSVASVLVEGPSIQGLLDWYGYNTIEEYLSDTYFVARSVLLTPWPESWLSSPFLLLVASRSANTSATPLAISALSYSSVIGVVVVVMAGVVLVLDAFLGGIFFKIKRVIRLV
ncbi:hypothetical protein Tco_0377607, partial [Tanacetum coccineum]